MMTVNDVLALLIALCRYLEVPPEALADFFASGSENQKYFDVLRAAFKQEER